MNFVVSKLRIALELEEKIIPLGIVYIGYPDEEKESRTQYKEEYIHII
jgi:nitroreductase